MKISAIQNISYRRSSVRLNKVSETPVEQTSPAFKGDAGRVVGGALGFLGACALVAVSGGLAAPAAVFGYLGVKHGAEAGHKFEEEIRKK